MKPYPKYKESGHDVLGPLPEAWDAVALRHLATKMGSGVTPRGGAAVYTEDGVAFIRSQNVHFDGLRLDNVQFIPEEVHEQMSGTHVQRNDVLLNITGASIGRCCIVKVDREMNVNQHVCIIRSSDQVLPEFLNSVMQSNVGQAQVRLGITGGNRDGLNLEQLREFAIPIPHLDEQQKIAAFLDHQTGLIDALITKHTELLALLDQQRKAIINEAVTKGLDPNAPMKDSGVEWLGEVPRGWRLDRLKRHFTIHKRIAGELGFDVLSVTQRGLKVKDLDNLQGQHSMDYTKYQLVYPGDFVMNHMDLLTGYVDLSAQTGVTSPDYRVFGSTSDLVDNGYFLFLFQLGYFRRIFFGLGRGVSDMGRWRLPATEFNDMVVPVPTIAEQRRIAAYLTDQCSAIGKASSDIVELIASLKDYRQSLISEAVTGKIDLRAWEPQGQSLPAGTTTH